MNGGQKIIWPWQTQRWPEVRAKFTDSKIMSIPDMESRISSLYTGKLRPKYISEMFNNYYNDPQYESGRVPKEIFIDKVLPYMQKLVENAQKTFRGHDARVLAPGENVNIIFTRPQVATIVTCMWFGLFNYKFIGKGDCKLDMMPDPTFLHAFTNQNMFILQCMVNYFTRVYQCMNHEDKSERDLFNAGCIVFKRNVLISIPDWISHTSTPITEIAIGEGCMDESPVKMRMVYSHDYIGGFELFNNTIAQESIILLTRPECLVATIICAKLNDNETLTIIGTEKISAYGGFGSSIKFIKNFEDPTSKGYSNDDTEVMTQCAIVFMDASPRTTSVSQFIDDFDRDLNKAFCGFNSLKFSKIECAATSNWPFGFNANNVQLKFIQQVMASSLAQKTLIYYPYGRDFESKVETFIEWVIANKLTVGGLYNCYLMALQECYTGEKTRLENVDIFDIIMHDI